MSETEKPSEFKIGDVVIARRHFIDRLDRRHLAGTVVGTVTRTMDLDRVEVDGVNVINDASVYVEVA